MAILSFHAATTLAAYRGVYISGTFTVAYPAATSVGNSTLPIGVTIDSNEDTTTGVAVACAGEQAELFFNDSVTAGSIVGLDTSGRGIPVTTGATSTAVSAPATYIGVLLDEKVDLTGTIAKILVMPGLTRVTA